MGDHHYGSRHFLHIDFMKLRLNGVAKDVGADTVLGLLLELGIDPERPGIAVALDGEVVRRSDWPATKLEEETGVEIITAMQGG